MLHVHVEISFTGIDPGTYCIIGLNRNYGSDQYGLGTGIIIVLEGTQKLRTNLSHFIIKTYYNYVQLILT